MMVFSRQSPLNIALIVFTGMGFCLLAIVAMPSWARFRGYSHHFEPAPNLALPKPVNVEPFGEFSVVLDHPLFNVDRAKDPIPKPLSQSILPSLDSYRLVGVVVSDDTSVALVERRSTKAILELKEGADLDGRTIQYITDSGLTFSGSDEVLSMPKVTGAAFVSQDAQTSSADSSETNKKKQAVGDRDKK